MRYGFGEKPIKVEVDRVKEGKVVELDLEGRFREVSDPGFDLSTAEKDSDESGADVAESEDPDILIKGSGRSGNNDKGEGSGSNSGDGCDEGEVVSRPYVLWICLSTLTRW